MVRSDDGNAPARIELVQNASMTGRDFAAQCVAPNVGVLTLRMQVPDAVSYASAIEQRGGTLFAKPQRLTVAPYGELTIFSIRSPEGALLEFYSTA
jgi:predicted enzyme related to lactoylglutathione lyase